MMVPTIARTTEQMLLLVPQAIREAAYGLGRFAMAYNDFDYAANSNLRRGHGRHAGLCPGRRRDRALAFHRVWQSILELEEQTSRPRLYRCRFLLTRFRRSTNGTGKRGRERWS